MTAGPVGPVGPMLATAVDRSLAYLRELDPDAADELGQLPDRQPADPVTVVVGETKRGKSSLVNALVGVPGLAPVDAGVASTAYLELVGGQPAGARAYLPDRAEPVPVSLAELPGWASAAGPRPDGVPPPRRIEIRHPAPLLAELSLVDTPGAGGLDPLPAEVTLAAVAGAANLLFVTDASAPLSAPELTFLAAASQRVELVVFALTKIDAYPGWRTVLADNRARLVAHAPRFGPAGWFPVSARLAELAATFPAGAAAELARESRIEPLREALRGLVGRTQLLRQANLLRAVRSELARRELAAGDQLRATDPDPGERDRIQRERAAVSALKRAESRQWALALRTETERARVESTTRLRTSVAGLQEQLLDRIDRARPGGLADLPAELDRCLAGLSVRLSQELAERFGQVGERALAELFGPDQLRHVLAGVNATLRHTLRTAPRRERAGPDQVMIAMSAGGLGLMAGRGTVAGVAALGIGTVAGSGLLVPVAGIGIGLAAGAFVLYRRRVAIDRQQARAWLREALAEARAALAEAVAHRFADLQYALTRALEDAVERRLRQLDGQLVEFDRALAADAARRARRRAELQAERETLRTRIGQLDEILGRARLAVTAN